MLTLRAHLGEKIRVRYGISIVRLQTSLYCDFRDMLLTFEIIGKLVLGGVGRF